MKKLKVLYANNTNNLFTYSLKSVSEFFKDLSKENIIIVPDKLSLATEQAIFDALNIDAYYNISVMGISKFANKIIQENNLNKLECSALQAKLLVLRAIQNVCENFKCFSKNYTLGFVDEMYTKIEQIKSSNAKIDDLIDPNAGLGTKLKFEDIKLIFNEYEKLHYGKLDSGDLLSVFNEISSESEILKNSNVFFVGFDSLTKQGLQVLKNVAKNANYTQISVVYAKNQNNYRIYDQTFFDAVINLCKQEKLECETVWCDLPYKNNNKNLILNNLFSREKKFDFVNDYYQIIKTNSFAEEIELCTKQINYLLKTENINLSDIAICADESYSKILMTELSSLGLCVYLDKKFNLFELEPTKYLIDLFKFSFNKNPKLLYQILSNDFCGIDNNFTQSYVTMLTSCNSVKLTNEKFIGEYPLLIMFIEEILQEKILKNDTINNYLENLKKYIKKYQFIEKISQKADFFEEKLEIMLNKAYLQIEKKLESVFESIGQTVGNTETSFDKFCEILEKCLTETEINSVPSTVNQIYIGDLKSFYFNKKYVFVLGMNEGIMPNVLTDTGLISDKEIISESIIAKLEPTTKIINKRNKFKLFENILSAEKKCFLYYHVFDAENKQSQPNEFLSELAFLFKNNIETAVSQKAINNDKQKMCFNLMDNYNANLILFDDINAKEYTKIKNALVKNDTLFKKLEGEKLSLDFSKLFFKDNKASVSVVEKYNACPRSAFLANALKLQPIKKDKLEANLIGTFLHEVGEVFVKNNSKALGKLSDTQITLLVEQIIQDMLKDDEYFQFTLPKNKFLLGLLKAEAIRFCSFINYEQSVSEFKPLYVEKYFGGKSDFAPITLDINGTKNYISGFVDRIDSCEDYFRIIDYKTGNTTNSKGAEHLFYGTKIQLFVYALAIKNNMDKKLFGVFYLPIKNGFSKNGNDYTFSGFFENNAILSLKCDKNMLSNSKSELLNVSLAKIKADGELKLKKKTNLLSDDELSAYLQYSIESVKNAIMDIESGYIDCSPIKDRCKICEFNKICKFAFDEKYERVEIYDVSSEAIKKLMEGVKYGK